MNFMKNTIFKKPDKVELPKEQVLHSGVLAVWGSPGSGKSTVATKLAKHLADKKKNVVLLLCDMTAPMLPCICPPSDLENNHSLGSILAAPHVTEPLVKYHMITHKKMDYLTILGMQKGENEYSYTPFGETQARELISALRKVAPFVIIDCGSYIANDVLSAVALLESDAVLRLANCDLKSISYLSSQLSTLQSAGLDFEKQYKCASNIKSNHGIEHMSGAMGSLSFTLAMTSTLRLYTGNCSNQQNNKQSHTPTEWIRI
jgi:MinD-like ATPase involved in chromosome partitioning or flagellar assembly